MTTIASTSSSQHRLGRHYVLPCLCGIAMVTIVIQIVHFGEHVAQFGYWMKHPDELPWMSSWAMDLVHAIARWTNGTMAEGMEIMHLAGNLIFLVGIFAAFVAARRYNSETATPWIRRSMMFEGMHLIEHVVLTVTVLRYGTAHGASTIFGLLTPGTTLAGGFRVWFHFIFNLVATYLAVRGMNELRVVRHRARQPQVNPATV